MKQVTGATNNKPEIKNVSIRLRLDGHSFSEEKLDIPAKEKKTVLILRDDEKVAIRKRPAKGLLAGLYELPNEIGRAHV